MDQRMASSIKPIFTLCQFIVCLCVCVCVCVRACVRVVAGGEDRRKESTARCLSSLRSFLLRSPISDLFSKALAQLRMD
jgi:hypothetical protein